MEADLELGSVRPRVERDVVEPGAMKTSSNQSARASIEPIARDDTRS